jgi:hypothetical protein
MNPQMQSNPQMMQYMQMMMQNMMMSMQGGGVNNFGGNMGNGLNHTINMDPGLKDLGLGINSLNLNPMNTQVFKIYKYFRLPHQKKTLIIINSTLLKIFIIIINKRRGKNNQTTIILLLPQIQSHQLIQGLDLI